MENQFLIDSEYLSKEALEKKHRLETDPSSRKNHMEYMEGMEQITNPTPSTIGTTNAKINQNSSQPKQSQVQNKSDKAVKSSSSGKYYKVKAGQTLYDISMKVYGTSKMVDEIKEYNDIDDDYTIIEGQKILLP